MEKTLGKYKLSFYDSKIIQCKDLISHDDYVNIIKPYEIKIDELRKSKKRVHQEEADSLKRELKSYFGDNWFTDKSPLFYAIKSGVIRTNPWQGDKMQCIIYETI